ncbi:hypothetical protein SODALDRAFT_266450 [Sodiomyces alkalinus F11]|uniref:ATP-dependent DNA ligase family profile domain-containing protein n=1 Tax=Sodiomyces alkalinus (strain CBS 110278 / VKM F-3762 / F11) TaxID=1314773 RepID=A0A3N2Q8X5_SODAK|nr:hypothetical protein SODALDRAFT_266450 [Sodiomyces alkalinus F11]ROT43075.1 hypothetical protein SODALDRAFT_266450 [Sodiomyces alkalinus F11]
MPFPFTFVCDLLEQVQVLGIRPGKEKQRDVIWRWFDKHRERIDHLDTHISALFSTMLPDKRTDRVYGIQAKILRQIVCRALCLGASRIAQLRRYEQPGSGVDLAECISAILKQTPSPLYGKESPVTVEEIDDLLNSVASKCAFSSPAVRASQSVSSLGSREDLGRLYLRLNATEAKWFTRLVLKTYEPVIIDPMLVYCAYDGRLGMILKAQEDFDVALDTLQKLKAQPPGEARGDLAKYIKPVLGTKVSRQFWRKGRSIKHCIDICHGRVSCEKKVDGEYCQVHVDLSEGPRCIQIFSKSGKDSTQDRTGVHQAIRNSLELGKSAPRIARGCILEGELVEGKIAPFHKIRKYVSRSGRFLNAEQDSPPDPNEHLMIVYFDVLLIDDESLLGLRQTERFKRLEKLICRRQGHAEIVERQIVDLAGPSGPSDLRRAFAASITSRNEGLVLKPDDPYFDFTPSRRPFSGSPVKVKKEYIGAFGDIGDFAVVGASYNPVKAKTYRIPGLRYTHFYIACLTNKEAVQRHRCRPHFTVVEYVELNEALLRMVVFSANPESIPLVGNEAIDLRVPPRIMSEKPPTMVFPVPLVFDVRCFSFDKQGNTGFWSPRFPAVTKVHLDRDYLDTITFTELQAVAEKAVAVPEMEDSQELLDWIARLEGADPRGIPVDAVTQSTISSMATPSPRASSARGSESPAAQRRQSPIKRLQPLPPLLEEEQSQSRALATPPTSSALTARQLASGSAEPVTPQGKGVDERYFAHDADNSPYRCKKRRLSIPPASCPARSQSPLPQKSPQPTQRRSPLADISVNTSQTSNRTTGSQTSRLPPGNRKHAEQNNTDAISGAEVRRTLTPKCSSSSQTLPALTPPVKGRPDMCHLGPQPRKPISCRYVGPGCMLGSRDFLLSPCVAKQTRMTEGLLPAHGITKWITNPKEWLEKCKPTSVQHGTRAPDKRRRKVCFVERRQCDATRALFLYIEKVNLRLADGGREWVEVYDWRVLEEMTRHEDDSDGPMPKIARTSIWEKWWVGLA